MTYEIVFLTNDTSRLIVSKHSTTDKVIADMIIETGKKSGHVVILSIEG